MPRPPDPERLMIRREEQEAARKRRPPLRRWPSSPRAAAPRGRVPPPPPPPLTRGGEKSPPLRLPGTLSAKRLKISLVLDAAELLAVPAPQGRPRVSLRIALPDRSLVADIAAKSLRKAQTAVREAGADAITILLQGNLEGDVIVGAGLSVQPKATKPKQAHDPTRNHA